MSQQVEDGDVTLLVRRVWEEAGNGIAERKPMLRSQTQNRRRGEAFCHRADVEFAGECQWLCGGLRISFLENDRVPTRDQDHSGKSTIPLSAEDGVESPGGLSIRSADQEQKQRDDEPDSYGTSAITAPAISLWMTSITELPRA